MFMKMCNDCNIDMIDGIELVGQHPFEIGVDGKSDIFLNISTGEKSSFFGIESIVTVKIPLMARMCPSCGKTEMYVNLKDKNLKL